MSARGNARSWKAPCARRSSGAVPPRRGLGAAAGGGEQGLERPAESWTSASIATGVDCFVVCWAGFAARPTDSVG